MYCFYGWIRKNIHAVPCFPALIVIIFCILSETNSPFFLIPAVAVVICICLVRAWRLALLCLLLGWCAWGITSHRRLHDASMASRYGAEEKVLVEVSGSVVRSFSRSVWLKCDSPATSMEVIMPEGVNMSVGERWLVRGVASGIPQVKTPGAFDRKLWLSRHHIMARLQVIECRKLGKGDVWSRILAASESYRDTIGASLAEGSAPGDSRTGVMTSLLLGDKRAMEPDALRAFRDGGCLHVFAVSGMHVGFAAGIFLFIFSFCRFHPITTRLLTLIPLAAYVFVTGMPVSAMRAFVMVCLYFVGTAMRRKVHPVNLLAFTAVLFLLLEPFHLYDAGFLLSFMIFAVVVIAGTWESRRPAWWSPDPFIPKRIYTWRERLGVRTEYQFRIAVIVSIFCWLVSIPVTIGCFGTFNLYAAVLNIALVPIVPIVMCSCFAGAALFWCPPALLACNAVSRCLAGLLLSMGEITADQPAALVHSVLPADAGEAILIPLSSKECALVCGNPAAVINPGTDADVRFTIAPAIRRMGVSPEIIWNTVTNRKKKEGEESFLREFPHALVPSIPSDLSAPCFIDLSEGGFITVFPPDKSLATGIAADRQAVVLWEYEGKRLLYTGTASLRTVERTIRQVGTINILVTAFHDKDPVDDAEAIISSGAEDVVFVLDDRHPSLPELPSPIRTWNLRETGVLMIDMKTGKITPWDTKTHTR